MYSGVTIPIFSESSNVKADLYIIVRIPIIDDFDGFELLPLEVKIN